MFKLQVHHDWFRTARRSSFGSDGQPELIVELDPGPELSRLQTKVDLMFSFFEDQQREMQFREQHPNLKEAWDHYQTLKTLVTPTKDLNGT